MQGGESFNFSCVLDLDAQQEVRVRSGSEADFAHPYDSCAKHLVHYLSVSVRVVFPTQDLYQEACYPLVETVFQVGALSCHNTNFR